MTPKDLSGSRLVRGRKVTQVVASQVVRDVGLRVSTVGQPPAVRSQRRDIALQQAAEQLVNVLGGMKGAAMKLGQMLSIIDLPFIPEESREGFHQKLAVLRDSAPEVDFSTMRTVIETELGAAIDDVFAEFDENVAGAASIGQVYRAVMHDGREVALKVKYPGIDAAVVADIKNLSAFLKFWRNAIPTIATSEFIGELRSALYNELDYVTEARTQRRVARKFAGHPFICVPNIIDELCTPSLLVTEWFEGLNFDESTKLDKSERDRIGEIVYRFYVGTIYREGEFCGDPHPGNVLLGTDGRVGFIDFGAYKEMDSESIEFERNLWRAGADSDGERIRELAVGRGIIAADTELTEDDCLEYTMGAFRWEMVDEQVTMTPELAGSVMKMLNPGGSAFGEIRSQHLPPEHMISRRVDIATASMLGKLGATANWLRIAREWISDSDPNTELGRLEAQWRRTRPGQSG
ncbi:ABC1 kinase family protein [Gordonia sp. CPCC 205333]|uniref:ABC1 kinase family protein n=1 Tax=Gordonia sp. CPCC 205333 TaxID=3140790 RepID=UPI003AF33D9B